MEKVKGFNRNLVGTKRPHRGISRNYNRVNIQNLNLTERLKFESERLTAYHTRIGKY